MPPPMATPTLSLSVGSMPKICNCWFIETQPVLGLIKAVDMPQAAVRAMQCDSIRFTSTRLESYAAHLQPPLPTQSVPWTAFGCTLLAFGSHEAGSAGGVVASMVVSQTADPGSIPGRRKADWERRNGQFLLFLLSLPLEKSPNRIMTVPLSFSCTQASWFPSFCLPHWLVVCVLSVSITSLNDWAPVGFD